MNIKSIISRAIMTALVGSGISSYDFRGSASAWVQDKEEPALINENELDAGVIETETDMDIQTFNASGWTPNGVPQEQKIYHPMIDRTFNVQDDNPSS